jgi:hypothetical protein
MFRRRSPHRLMTALFVVVSLLFAQLALASYVCPAAADTTAMAQMMAAGEPCEGMDAAQPALCHEHAASASQSFQVVKVATPSPPMIVQVLVVPVALDESIALAFALALSTAATPEAKPPPDPIYLSTLRLRV